MTQHTGCPLPEQPGGVHWDNFLIKSHIQRESTGFVAVSNGALRHHIIDAMPRPDNCAALTSSCAHTETGLASNSRTAMLCGRMSV